MPDVNWVNDEFELGFDETFEKRWRYVELVGRFVMTVFVAATLAGLLGQGPFSHHRAFDHNHSLAVDYEPIARQGTETQITFHILHAPPDATEIALTLSNGFGEPFNMASTVPLPERSIVGTNGTTLIFPIRPNDRDDLIRLKGTPSVTGPLQLSANLDNEPGVTWTHFVVP